MPSVVEMTGKDAVQHAAVLSLLSRIWARELDSRTLAAMNQDPFLSAWRQAGGLAAGSANEKTLEELAVDYCQLLVGPRNHVSPIQSVWDQKRFQGNATASMKKYIDMLTGFQPCVDIQDHVAVQLQLFGTLVELSAQAKKPVFKGLTTAFAQDHLEWTYPFFEQLEAKAQTPFYQSAARVSRSFLFGS